MAITAVDTSFDELIRAGSILTRELNFKSLISILVEQSLDVSRSDLACLYLYIDPEKFKSSLRLIYRRGKYDIPQTIDKDSELIDFIKDCDEATVLLERKKSPFSELLLNERMQSGMVLPISTPKAKLGVVFLNSLKPNYYNRSRFSFLNSFVKLAGGMMHNAKMYQELKDYLRKIEELEIYQENIFTSMTNLLITTDEKGKIRYFNNAAKSSLHLTDKNVGNSLDQFFKGTIDKKILDTINKTQKNETEVLGIEGIYKKEKEIDFSLNLSPLKSKYGKYQGITLLFTDQSKERELQQKMQKVITERRLIKDMFSRYLSKEIVQKLTESPDLVKPHGDKKNATIFFADIRGYTSFSEGQSPEYIIEILNEYFKEAVEIVIQHKGYIDKFIGDCIMAAWGVPLQTEKEDAIQAVSCAVEIQRLVKSKKRSFFTGKASHLQIGIGMHTGPLVAGNLGSARRMDYTVIGDTVNVAARLEGVAGPGEVVITHDTRNYLGDLFKLEEREAVKVKGKAKPIRIYNVIDKK